MLGLSTKTIYAVAALHQLGKLESDEVMKIKEIAAKAQVPPNFLEQILLELKKKGILESIKGAYGGYRLARPLSQITLAQVAEVLETDLFDPLYRGGNLALELFWDAISLKGRELMDVALSELYEYELKASGALHYTI